MVVFIKHEYEEIVNWYFDLYDKYINLVRYVPSIGKSEEGRDQPAIHITASTDLDPMKYYFQCQIHASK